MKEPFVVTAFTYATMLYQIGFVFMLHHRLHLIWVLVGVSLHLGILVMMGLTTFSIAMIGMILFTIRDPEWRQIRAFSTHLYLRFISARGGRIFTLPNAFSKFGVLRFRQRRES